MFSLEAQGYVSNETLGIWSRPNYPGIAYSDGDSVEEHLLTIVRNTQDLSVLSAELRQQCQDWVTLYHLSSQRANVLRPFTAHLKGDVLEIGAGCGAISRFLGENGGQILALEGSPRRATIAASRTRDLDNVTVLAERFDDFNCERQFDVVTLVGVLEYASMFSNSANPSQSMLEKVRRLLKPGGHLLIAIENQLGLKYFAGAPEDHIGQAMYGIEGRYQIGQPQTFGRQALDRLIKAAGFPSVQFLAAFPDYKLPRSIVTERGCSTAEFDAAALAWQSVHADPQLPDPTHFDLARTWPTVFGNQLGMDLANSFIIAASLTEAGPIDPQVLAYHYTTDRSAPFCKEAIFLQNNEQAIVVRYRKLAEPPQDSDASILYQLQAHAEYLTGELLSQKFIELMSSPGWLIADMAQLIRRYLETLDQIMRTRSQDDIDLSFSSTLLPGHYIDALPHNIIIGKDGTPRLFDIEWVAKSPIELGYLLCRGLFVLMQQVKHMPPPAGIHALSRQALVESVLRESGIPLEPGAFDRYHQLETTLVSDIYQGAASIKDVWRPFELLIASSDLHARAYYCSEGESFDEQNTADRPLLMGRQQVRLEMTLPDGPIARIRFDPIDHPHWFVLHEAVMRDKENREVWRFSAGQPLESLGMRSLPPGESGTLFYALHEDPQMYLPVPVAEEFLALDVDIELLDVESVMSRFENLQQQLAEQRAACACAEISLTELRSHAENLDAKYQSMQSHTESLDAKYRSMEQYTESLDAKYQVTLSENRAIKASKTWKIMRQIARLKRTS